MFISSGMTAYADILADMHAQCFEKAWRSDDFSDLLVLPTTLGWMTERGFLLCSRVGDEMEILTIGVLPDFRCCGEGFSLINQMISYAESQSVKRIFLEVSDDNLSAQSLYVKSGFSIIGRRKGYYETSAGRRDAICMQKETASF